MVAVIDTGAANVRSVIHAIRRAGREAVLTRDAGVVESTHHVILPGVGHAARVMSSLHEAGLVDVLRHRTMPLLGICLGMQVLFEWSEEGDVPCIGRLPGIVRRLPDAEGCKIPHVGWSRITDISTTVFDGIAEGSWMYFVHSYAVDVSSRRAATCRHGRSFAAAVVDGLTIGVQFHPEKSGDDGQRLFNNFLRL